MNIEEMRRRAAELADLMRGQIDEYQTRGEDFDDEAQTRFDEWDAEATKLRADIDRQQARIDAVLRAESAGRTAIESGDHQFNINTRSNPYDLSTLRLDVSAADLRGRAAAAIEADPILPDPQKETATATLRKVDRRGELALMILATGDPHYRTAFPKVMAGAEWALDDNERRALMRAQSMSNAAGGFAVPFTLDPTVVLTNNGALNPMRQIATVKTITTEDWNGVTSAGATAHWRGEGVQVDDDGITLAQPNIPVFKMDIFIPYSIEIEMDWAQMESELRTAIDDARLRLEATAHISGNGTSQPFGLVTALTGTASELAPTVAEAFGAADVYKIRRSVPARYRGSGNNAGGSVAKWAANMSTYDATRQFDTGGGGGFWTDMNNGTPDRLLGYSTYEFSAMDEAANINPAVVGNNRILICGDFSRYVIVDRVGMRIENIPHLFGTANNRPTGQRGIYAMLRTGADSIDDNAFRMLNVTTS